MFLAVRELLYSKLRYILVVLIMFLLSLLVLVVSGLAQGLANDNAAAIQNMQADAEYFVMDEEADLQLTRSLVGDEDQETVGSLVEDVWIFGVHQGVIEDDEEVMTDVTKFYVDKESPLFPAVTEGELPSEVDEVLANDSLQEDGYEVGDRFLDDTTGDTFTISGFTSNQTFSHTPVLFVTEEAWLEMGSGDPAADDELLASALVLSELEPEVVDMLGNELVDAEVVTIEESLSGIPGYSEEQGSLWMMIVFLFIISAIVIAAFFYVITIQKLTQFGILKAIGAGVGNLAAVILVQVAMIALVSVGLGIGGTYLFAAFLPAGMPFMLPFDMVLLLAGLFIVLAILGSLLSLYKVKNVDALEAMGGMEG